MKTNIRPITDGWTDGYVLDKHTSSSVYLGEDEYGHARYDTTRTEVGEALYRLKYKDDWSQVAPLAAAVLDHIVPRLHRIGLIVPMPATHSRARQPVTEIARALGKLMAVPVFEKLLLKDNDGATQLKNMRTKEEKEEALAGRFQIVDEIEGKGRWNALLIDDLFHTGASMEAACAALRSYAKIADVYVAALTWR